MTSHSASVALIEQWTAPWRARRRWLLLAVALLLAALAMLAIAARLGAVVLAPRDVPLHLLLQPAVIVYIVAAFPWLQKRWALAMVSLQALGLEPDRVARAGIISLRGERLAMLVGALLAPLLTYSYPITGFWLTVYYYIADILMFGLMALTIYDGGVRTRQLAGLVNADLKLDLFDRQALVPLARWGQTITLTFVGGTCLSLLFQSHRSLFTVASAVIYSTMIAVSLGLFFTSTWSLHAALRAARDRELADVQRRLAMARDDMRRQLAQQPGPEAAEAYRPVVMLGLYERQVLEASTWPFNPKIVKEVAASVAVPVLIYLAKIAVGVPGAA